MLGTVRSAWTNGVWPVDNQPIAVSRLFAGSYAVNYHLLYSARRRRFPNFAQASPPWSGAFVTEQDIRTTTATPVVADGAIWWVSPHAENLPSNRLFSPDWETSIFMAGVAIPRHGRRPLSIPAYWPITRTLPGAVNVAMFDGHVELVKLDKLWQLYWHKDFRPPQKRPGLP